MPRFRARRFTWASGVCGADVSIPDAGGSQSGTFSITRMSVADARVEVANILDEAKAAGGQPRVVHLDLALLDEVRIADDAIAIWVVLLDHHAGHVLLPGRANHPAELVADLGAGETRRHDR